MNKRRRFKAKRRRKMTQWNKRITIASGMRWPSDFLDMLEWEESRDGQLFLEAK